jgi:hypothetical protein
VGQLRARDPMAAGRMQATASEAVQCNRAQTTSKNNFSYSLLGKTLPRQALAAKIVRHGSTTWQHDLAALLSDAWCWQCLTGGVDTTRKLFEPLLSAVI